MKVERHKLNAVAYVKCAHPDCAREVHARGLCDPHYRALLRPAKRVNPCGCGCGGLTSYRFLHGHHTRLFSAEEQARRARHNDGSALRDTGSTDCYRKVRGRHEHRRVAEQNLGRPLLSSEIVHHRNGDKKDNHPDNLEVMTRSQHIAEHRQQMVEALRAKTRS